MREMTESEVQATVDWERARRRPAGLFHLPTPGFGGPTGSGTMTLWLPSPRVVRDYQFSGGRWSATDRGGCLDEPHLRRLRDEVISSLSIERAGIVSVDLRFLDYATAVVALNYGLTDQEVSLVLSGNAWMQPMILHVLGGDDVVRVLGAHGGEMARRIVPPAAALPRARTEKRRTPSLLRRLWSACQPTAR